MDLEDYVWAAIIIYSFIKRVLQKRGEQPGAGEKAAPGPKRPRPTPAARAGTPGSRPPASRPAVATTSAEFAAQTMAALRALKSHAHSFRAGLSPGLQRALGPLLAEEIDATSDRLLIELDRAKADAMRLAGIARASREHMLESTRLLARLDAIAKRRGDATLSALHRTADRLVAAAAVPVERHLAGEAATQIPAPLPLVLDDDRDSPLFANFALLPTAILDRPYYWALLASTLGRWVVSRASGLDQEVGDKLELHAETSSDAGPDRVARVLFGAWRRTVLADAIAAQWLGPSYLRALSMLLREPATPTSVVSVAIDRDGVVASEAPPHVRVHLAARWLAITGTPEADLAPLIAEWDRVHGQPKSLRLTGEFRGNEIPLAPFFATGDALLERLRATPLDALGGGRLGDLPGFDDRPLLASRIANARAALAARRPSPRHLRATLAAAIDAAFSAPETSADINAWLLRSTADTVEAVRRVHPGAMPSLNLGRGRITRRHAAHAQILGEILLIPRSRS